jgi:hypothetical protein
MVSRPVCLVIKHPSGAYDQIFITLRQLRFYVGLSLWREDGSVVYNCSWPSPAQPFSGPSPVGLVTIFYCLRFETFIPSPPTTRRDTVEVFEPVSIRESNSSGKLLSFYNLARTEYRTLSPTIRVFVCCNLRIRCHGNAYQSRSNQRA